MVGKFAISLATASLILAGSALAQQPSAEPQTPPGGQPGTMMAPGKMGPGMMGHGDWAPWMMGQGGHHGMMMSPGMIQAFAEGKLAFLKSWLGITEAQNGPWNAFADAVRTQAKSLAESQKKWVPTPDPPRYKHSKSRIEGEFDMTELVTCVWFDHGEAS